MSAQDLEQRARELLAAEYEAAGESWAIWGILNSPHEHLINSLRLAIRAIVAALRHQPAPVDLEQFRAVICSWREYALTKSNTYVTYTGRTVMKKRVDEADRLLSIIDNAGKVAHQPAPVVDDARMARALEWVRTNAAFEFPHIREHLPAIEEAIAAYDPACGARTVRVVGDGNGVRACSVLTAARAKGVQS